MIESKIEWKLGPETPFLDGKYKRIHQWIFDGGLTLDASSSPEIVPVPMSDPALIDPEEAFVASVASCHMLFFLSIAAKRNFVVTRYEDNPEGVLAQNDAGKLSVVAITLKPACDFGGTRLPDRAGIQELHKLAHAQCFLANSVKTKITIENL